MASRTEPERIASLESAIPHLATKAGVEGVRVEIQGVRTELESVKADVAVLKTDVSALKADLKSIRSELKNIRWFIGMAFLVGAAVSLHIIYLLNQVIANKSFSTAIPQLQIT